MVVMVVVGGRHASAAACTTHRTGCRQAQQHRAQTQAVGTRKHTNTRTSRDEDPDACHVGDVHGGGHGGGSVALLGQHQRQVAAAGLAALVAQLRQLLEAGVVQSHADHPVEDGDGGRHRAIGPRHLFHLARGVVVLRVGHTVADDGRLQRHHRAALVEGLLHLGRHHEPALVVRARCQVGQAGAAGAGGGDVAGDGGDAPPGAG